MIIKKQRKLLFLITLIFILTTVKFRTILADSICITSNLDDTPVENVSKDSKTA